MLFKKITTTFNSLSIGVVVEMLKSINKNHGKRVYLSGFLCLLLFFYSSFGNSIEAALDKDTSLSLFSISIHRESLHDIYIAAIFAPSNIENYRQLKDPTLAKRMSFKFLSKYSSRQMSRLIKQRIALNNSKASWRPYTTQIVKIANLFKTPMQSGDQLDIDYIPNQGVKIYLNQTLFLTIAQAEVYQLLLNIWIGNIPPTEAFKVAIRGEQSEQKKLALVEIYQSITTQIGRFDHNKVKANKVKVVAKKIIRRKKKPLKKSPVKKKTIPISKVVKSTTSSLPSAVQTIVTKKVTSQAKKVENKPVTRKPKTTNNKDSVLANNRVPIDIPISIVEQAVDKDLVRGSYTQTLIEHIRKYQYYPKKALIAELQGSVTLRITIDREGNILSRKLVKRSGSRILDREVLKMVGKATPYPVIPKELEITTFAFNVPLNFTLSD